jgi:hypothetical protein
VLNIEATARVSISTGDDINMPTVYKPAMMILGTTQTGWISAKFYQLSVSGPTFASTLYSSGGVAVWAKSMADIPGTNNVFVYDGAHYTIVTLNNPTLSSATSVATGGDSNAFLLLYISSLDAWLLGSLGYTIQFMSRSNYAILSTAGVGTPTAYFLIDNLDDKFVFLFTDGRYMRHFNRLTWTTGSDNDMPDLSLTAYTSANNILNFGPYQYALTIPAGMNTSPIVIVSKTTLTLTDASMTINAKMSPFTPHFGTLESYEGDYYLLVFDMNTLNFQSYSLTVENCTSRDSNRVCQTCQSGLVRNNLMPDNNCVPASDYTGYVADTVNTLLSLCPGNSAAPVGVGCRATDCTGGTTYCTTCDVANSFYLLNGVCYVYASIPDGYGIVTAGQQALAACTDTNCLKCVDNKATCTRCKDSLGYYMNTNTSLCQHISAVASGNGANLVTFEFDPCSDTHCYDCKADYTACIECNTAQSYFMNVNVNPNICQLDSTIDDFFGADSVSKTFVACSMTGCQKCQSDYLACTQCDFANSYFMNTNTTTCQLASTAPDGFGPNLQSPYQLLACTDQYCKDCRSDYSACAVCDHNNGYYMNTVADPDYCQLATTAATNYGPNLLTYQLEPCTDTHCDVCVTDINVCTLCDTGSNYYFNVQSGLCQDLATVGSGFGLKSSDSTIVACNDPNCNYCVNDYMVCTECNYGASYYKNTTDGICQLLSTSADGYGAKGSPDYTLVQCSDPNCLKCVNDYTVCTNCQTLNNYYMNTVASPNYCQLGSTAADGYGINDVTGTLDPCTDLYCLKCVNDYTVCTNCQTANNYYMNTVASPNYCQLGSTAADGYGINDGTGTLDPCTDPNCLNCVNDYTVCTLCQTANNYYMNTVASPNYCQMATTASSGYGPNLVTFELEPCTDTHCDVCVTDINVCTLCYTAANYYWNPIGAYCQLKSTIADTYGVELSTFQVVSCVDSNCQNCVDDSQTCTLCQTSSGYYINSVTQICQLYTASPAGFGINSALAALVPCSDPGCLLCQDDYQVCITCDAYRDYFMNTTSNTCQLAPSIVDGYGINQATQQIDQCTDPNCQRCLADYTLCTVCNNTRDFYMNTSTSVCQSLSTMAPGYRVASSSFYEACSDVHCWTCTSDKQVCDRCRTDLRYYMNTTSGLCELFDNQPLGFGIDSSTWTYKACKDPNCYNCSLNYSTCTRCKVAQNFFMNMSLLECKSRASADIGFRGNITTGEFEACQIANCSLCEKNRSICDACRSGEFLMVGNKCVLPRTTSRIPQYTKFSNSDLKGTVIFGSHVEFQPSWADQLDIILLDVYGNKSYTSSEYFNITPNYQGFDIKINLEAYIALARIYITKKEGDGQRRILQASGTSALGASTTSGGSSDLNTTSSSGSGLEIDVSGVPEEIFPVIVENFTLLNEPTQRQVAEAAGSTVSSFETQRAVANIVLMNVNMNAAMLLDRLLADYEYLGLIGKQNLTYTRLLLDPAIQVKLAPFDFPGTDKETKEGPIEKAMRHDCPLEYFYYRNDVNCGFFQNYGSDLVTLVFIFVVTSLIYILGVVLRRKGYLNDNMPEPGRLATSEENLRFLVNKIGCLLTVNFGLQFFFAKMDSNALKILIFAFLNVYKMDSSWQMGIGFAVSFLIIVYFGVFVYFAWAFARGLKKAIYETTKEKREKGKYLPGPLKTSMKMNLLKYGFMSKPYEELRNDLNFFEIYYPVVLILRDILIALSIVLLSSKPEATPILTGIFEALILLYCIATRTKSKKVENAVDIFSSVCRIFYSILAWMTFSYEIIPMTLDSLMFFCLLLNTMGCLFLMAYVAILEVYSMLVIIFAKSIRQTRFKTSEERIKETYDPRFIKFRAEILEEIEKNPRKIEALIDRLLFKERSSVKNLDNKREATDVLKEIFQFALDQSENSNNQEEVKKLTEC